MKKINEIEKIKFHANLAQAIIDFHKEMAEVIAKNLLPLGLPAIIIFYEAKRKNLLNSPDPSELALGLKIKSFNEIMTDMEEKK